MSYIGTVEPEAASDEVLAMYRRQQAKFGYLPNYARVFCHRPEIMSLWADLQAGIRRHMTPRRFELVTLAAALALRNSYCALAHATELARHLSVEQLRDIVSESAGSPSELPVSAAELAMMRYAARMAADPLSVAAEDVAELAAHGLSDAEIFDIAATVAGRAFLTRLMDGLGVEADAGYAAMDPQLRDLLMVGRSLSPVPSRHCPET